MLRFIRQSNLWRNERAFSLVELIITISIIAALAALFLPMAQKVQMIAWRTDGMKSMHTLMNAIFLYAAENDGLLPGPTDRNQYPYVKRQTSQLAWNLRSYMGVPDTATNGTVVKAIAHRALLAKYDSTYKVFTCIKSIYIPISGSTTQIVYPMGITDQGYSAEDMRPKKLASIPTPTVYPAIMDLDAGLYQIGASAKSVLGSGTDLIPKPIFETGRHAAFWDGHVEFVSLDFNVFPYRP